ncbi:MAG TPA: histidine phosphatase family protein [Segeticoccus sp.]|uniref:SixA phosphatase family protein n=1 Tax=Segeticoccus sp. TaxID=2706531 RepID=UPI002D7FBAC5|nr:histidine phosphatase family protein [Segeticoccus sp.]HET8601462.1 histidine phosphatase family protein [Segeticoccus sp.]
MSLSENSDTSDRTLILLRHAKAEKGRDKADAERELADRGMRDAEAVGEWIVEATADGHVPPIDVVVCSTALRTKQTWEAAVAGGAEAGDVWYDRTVYNASPEALLDVVHELPEDCSTAVIVGHSPGVPWLAGLLMTDEEAESSGVDVLEEGWPTAGLAVLRCDGPWEKLQPHSAHLQEFVVPRG